MSIPTPRKPRFETIGENAGRFVISDCYPGYGTTIGNALRRVLLSSLEGAGITSVKIKGVSHEFSTIEGVLEDVVQIILNLKRVRVRSFSEEPIKLTLSAKGEGEVTAGQIKTPSDVEIVNPDHLIATITDKKASLEMELEVQRGVGYVAAEQREDGEKEIGKIAIDTIFTPIRRVNYSVENVRVGKRTDYDKVSVDIYTDGTVTPAEAFSQAVEILMAQFEALSGRPQEVTSSQEEVPAQTSQEKEESKEAKPAEEVISDKEAFADTPVSELPELPTRVVNILTENKIQTVSDICALSEKELLAIDGLGEKAVKEIKKSLGTLGITIV